MSKLFAKVINCPLKKLSLADTCADPGIFIRGGPGQSDKKKSSDVFFFFFFFFFLVLSLFHRSKKVKWSISKKSIIFEGSRGVQHFPGGGGGPIAYSL